MGAADRVRELVRPIVEGEGVQLYDVEHEGGILRIMLDRDGGIDVDTIGDVSQVISRVLDEHDPVPDNRYLLEVTSPGIERRLRLPEHFQSQLGNEINLKVRRNVEGDRRFEARLESVGKKGIDVTVHGPEGPQSRHLSYDDIESARLVFRWPGQPKPNAAPVAERPVSEKPVPKTRVSEKPVPKTSATNKKASKR